MSVARVAAHRSARRGVLLLGASLSLLPCSAPAAAPQTLVSAATSLSGVFTELGAAFAAEHPAAGVLFNFGASGALVMQLEAGAPADVLATADRATMDLAEAKGLLLPGSRRIFAGNRLVLIAPAGTAQPGGLADLNGPAVRRIAVGKPTTTPFGRYGAQALEHAGLAQPLSSKLIPCDTVRQALDYVARGEVDAGIVFSTDALLLTGKVRVVTVLDGHEPVEYSIAILRGTRDAAAASAFVAFISGPRGRALLARFGFLPPRP